MFNPILLQEVVELNTRKGWSVVRHYSIWKTKLSERGPQLLNGSTRRDGSHLVDLKPFRMCVNQDQEHVSQKRPCKVQMESGPWSGRPLPRLQWTWGWAWTLLLTHTTATNHRFDLSVHSWPPAKHPCHSFHLGNTWMSSMQLCQYLTASLGRYNNS